MAEALWNQLGCGEWEAYSAGSAPVSYVHSLAIEAMREIGGDLSTARSKPMREFAGQHFDLVVTVCDDAREACPIFPGATRLVHWPFDDPAKVAGTKDDTVVVFRRVRDQIRERVASFLRDAPNE